MRLKIEAVLEAWSIYDEWNPSNLGCETRRKLGSSTAGFEPTAEYIVESRPTTYYDGGKSM